MSTPYDQLEDLTVDELSALEERVKRAKHERTQKLPLNRDGVVTIKTEGATFSTVDRMIKSMELLKHAAEGKPLGIANMMACMGLVYFLSNENSDARKELSNFIGCSTKIDLEDLKDQVRYVAALLGKEARELLPKHRQSFMKDSEWFGCDCLELAGDVESQVNNILKKKWSTSTEPFTENLFKPKQLYNPDDGAQLIAVLLALELIKVEWQQEFNLVKTGVFNVPYLDSPKRKLFATDKTPRTCRYAEFSGGKVVSIACKPQKGDTKQRSMLLILPKEGAAQSDLDGCLQKLMVEIEKSDGLPMRTEKVDLLFPRFKGTFGPEDMKQTLEKLGVKSIFCDNTKPFTDQLPLHTLSPYWDPAFISKVLHFASFEADGVTTRLERARVPLLATVGSGRHRERFPL